MEAPAVDLDQVGDLVEDARLHGDPAACAGLIDDYLVATVGGGDERGDRHRQYPFVLAGGDGHLHRRLVESGHGPADAGTCATRPTAVIVPGCGGPTGAVTDTLSPSATLACTSVGRFTLTTRVVDVAAMIVWSVPTWLPSAAWTWAIRAD